MLTALTPRLAPRIGTNIAAGSPGEFRTTLDYDLAPHALRLRALHHAVADLRRDVAHRLRAVRNEHGVALVLRANVLERVHVLRENHHVELEIEEEDEVGVPRGTSRAQFPSQDSPALIARP